MTFDSENFPDLPPTWATVLVGAACELVTVKDKIQNKNYLRSGVLAVVDQGSVLIGGYTNETSLAVATSLPVVVFGDHTRALKFIDFPFAAGADGIKVLRSAECFIPRLFFRFLQAIRLPDNGYARHFQHLRSSQLAMPPRNEQFRLVDKLDLILARVDACRERLDSVAAILKRFRQSVLAAATSGDLTEDWRALQSRHRDSWSETTVGNLIERIHAGLNLKCDERPPGNGEIRLVEISAVTWGLFNENESKTLLEGASLPEVTRIRPGDFLISRANTLELVAACVIVSRVKRAVFLSDKVLRLVAPDRLKVWLLYVLRSDIGRRQIEELASGNQLSMRNLSQANLKRIRIPMPEEDERNEIVRRVESLFAYADCLEARYQTARAQVDRLTPALLAKAFRGELVPQDPTDEPAGDLLARIRSGVTDRQMKRSPRGRRKALGVGED